VKKGYRGRGRSRGGTGIKGGRWDGRKKDYPPPNINYGYGPDKYNLKFILIFQL